MMQAPRSAPPEEVSPSALKAVMARFATGVTIVAALEEETPVGFTCQSFVSLSIDPPLISICPAKSSTSWPRMVKAGRFSVNILAVDQGRVCAAFARSGADKFSSIAWHLGEHQTPIIDGVLASIECELLLVHEAGDHELVIGQVLSLDANNQESLVYFKSRLGSFVLDQ
jgi:3-hydroxy-9,10-secoandrosta-1,3,5(10)-triene-9,17-dione monooxygenase reductase component